MLICCRRLVTRYMLPPGCNHHHTCQDGKENADPVYSKPRTTIATASCSQHALNHVSGHIDAIYRSVAKTGFLEAIAVVPYLPVTMLLDLLWNRY